MNTNILYKRYVMEWLKTLSMKNPTESMPLFHHVAKFMIDNAHIENAQSWLWISTIQAIKDVNSGNCSKQK